MSLLLKSVTDKYILIQRAYKGGVISLMFTYTQVNSLNETEAHVYNYIMQNKEKVNGQLHDRPCFYAFQDSNTQLFWMIPFSSQVSKFKGIYNKKMQKYHRCDTIVFGEVLGHEKAFLIQNMCPITEKYMKNEYLDSAANIPVRVDGRLEKELKDKAGKVLALQRKGAKLIFPDVLSIEQELL